MFKSVQKNIKMAILNMPTVEENNGKISIPTPKSCREATIYLYQFLI